MNKGKKIRLSRHINPDIKTGDKVRIFDGSALTCDQTSEDLFLVFAFPKLTGSDKILKELVFEVIETGINDKLCFGPIFHDEVNIYGQDITLNYNNKTFRTCSAFLNKI